MSSKLISTRKLILEKDSVEKWLVKEFGAKNIKADEWQFSCPFCDTKGAHQDYTFNTDKMCGRDWRGFDSKCESGHTITSLVALYYGITFPKARSFIRSKFQTEDSVQRIKKKLREVKTVTRYIEYVEDDIFWEMPKEAVSLLHAKSKDAIVALYWLLEKRKIPREIVELIHPRYLGIPREKRWYKYKDRVFFPIKSNGNQAWLAYAHRKGQQPKTLNPPGKILSNMFFLYDFYKDSKKPVILCEGLFDALRFFVFGYNASPLFGTNISNSQIDMLNLTNSREVVVCLDSDAINKSWKLASKLNKFFFHNVSVMELDTGDPDELSYKEAKFLFDNRKRVSWLAAKMQRIKRLT